MDTLELAPGAGIGPFRLGDSLWHVLDLLRSRKGDVPRVEVSWNPENAHKSAVTVHAGPIALLFPPGREQRLMHIRLTLEATTLTYEGTVLASPSRPLTRSGIAFALGPTYSGSQLKYPGVSFEFGEKGDVVADVSVTPKEELEAERCTILPGRGVVLKLSCYPPVEITLGLTTAQDVLLDLGPPLRKFWKEDERLDRVWGQGGGAGGCFWNYFQYGLDVLIVDDVVDKIIAYSNIPGTPLFQQYARCPWVVDCGGGLDIMAPLSGFKQQLRAEESGEKITLTPLPTAPSAPADEPEGSKKKKKKDQDKVKDVPKDKGTDKDKGYNHEPELSTEAMVLDRSVEGGLEGTLNLPRSQLLGFAGLVLEVDEASGGVAGVQVWRE